MKKVLLVATVQSHIGQFHKPLMSLLKENDYVEQNGKLYMSQTLGIGGPVVTKVEMSIRKDSDTRYTVAMTESYEETMTSQSERHLIQVDGSWVWDSIICASDDVSFSKK